MSNGAVGRKNVTDGDSRTLSRTVLAVMARYPTAGAVKTRLARIMGAERACMLYRAFLADLETRFTAGPRPLVWVFSPPDAPFSKILAAGARCMPQRGRNLGERMHSAFGDLCREGYDRVILIGSDTPHLRDTWLDEAERRLDDVDVVLGPSADGGYYLIALRQPHDVFSGILMSTGRVLEQTLQKAAARDLRVHLLPSTFDIDEYDDLVQLGLLIQREGERGLQHTAAVLAKIAAEYPETRR